MTDQTYIWIVRWEDFQHYAPIRDRGPAWIKDYTAQMSDERYLRLTDRQRALLRDLRDIFATFRGRLPDDHRMITRQRNSQTRRDDLIALNDAGFIRFLSRPSLDLALEAFYASRAPARSQEQEKREEVEENSTSTVSDLPEPSPEPEANYDADIDFGPSDMTAGPALARTQADIRDDRNGAGAGAGDLERINPQALLEQIGNA